MRRARGRERASRGAARRCGPARPRLVSTTSRRSGIHMACSVAANPWRRIAAASTCQRMRLASTCTLTAAFLFVAEWEYRRAPLPAACPKGSCELPAANSPTLSLPGSFWRTSVLPGVPLPHAAALPEESEQGSPPP
eukprot:356868-Chlamydomonas_euryale.AAC.3